MRSHFVGVRFDSYRRSYRRWRDATPVLGLWRARFLPSFYRAVQARDHITAEGVRGIRAVQDPAPETGGGAAEGSRRQDGRARRISSRAIRFTRCAAMLRLAPAAVAPVREVSPACRPCKRSAMPAPYRRRTLARPLSPTAARCESAPTAGAGVPVSSRSCGFSSNSSFGVFSFFPCARGWPADIIWLFTCCGPCAMLACRANTAGGMERLIS
jgi:hypothetical protein